MKDVRDNKYYQNNHLNKLNNNPVNQYNQLEHNKEYKDMQWDIRFLRGKPHINCGDKKTTRSKTVNLNLLFKIKLHRFIWPLFPKDLLSSTYNLIHVRDTVTSYCSLVVPSTTLKGWWSSTQDSKNQFSNERSGMMWHFRFSL